jgi:predicted secreted protein
MRFATSTCAIALLVTGQGQAIAAQTVTAAGGTPFPCSASKAPDYVPIENRPAASLSYSIPLHSSVAFVLPANPSTGYSWSFGHRPDRAIAEPVGAWTLAPKTAGLGVPQGLIWVVRGAGPGTTSFSLVYSRPWERSVPPAKTVSVTVKVQTAPAGGC